MLFRSTKIVKFPSVIDGLLLKNLPIYAKKISTCLVECRPFKVLDIHFPVALSLIGTHFDLLWMQPH